MRYFNVRTEKDLKGKISSQEHGHERESESSPPRPVSTRSIVVTRDPPPTSSSAVERGAKEHVLARAVIVSSGVGQLWGDPKDEYLSFHLTDYAAKRLADHAEFGRTEAPAPRL